MDICETCVTVTWEQMNLQLLRLTGDPRFADQMVWRTPPQGSHHATAFAGGQDMLNPK